MSVLCGRCQPGDLSDNSRGVQQMLLLVVRKRYVAIKEHGLGTMPEMSRPNRLLLTWDVFGLLSHSTVYSLNVVKISPAVIDQIAEPFLPLCEDDTVHLA